MSTITSLGAGDTGATSRGVINTNFTNLNTDKVETSVLDTDGTLAANSDAKVATQKAVKTYVDGQNVITSVVSASLTSGNVSVSTVPAQVVFNTELVDRGTNFASGTFTAPLSGQYKIDGFLTSTYGASGDNLIAILYKNDSPLYYYQRRATTNLASYDSLAFSQVLTLAAADTIKLYVATDTGTATVYATSANGATMLSVVSIP